MSAVKQLAPYLALFGVASAAALTVATRGETAKRSPGAVADVPVWGGKASAVQRIEFKSPKLELALDAHFDDQGRWFSGSTKKLTLPPATSASAAASAAPPPSAPESTSFVAVKQANQLAELLAPLQALRLIGLVELKDLGDFGLDKPEGTLTVNVGGALHELVFGGATPGGDDRYVKYSQNGAVYAISGEIARNLLFADTRLIERELHLFDATELERATVKRGGATRSLVRVADKRDTWADASTPGTQDEAATNWMSKLAKLRPSGYVERPAQEPQLVLRVELASAKKPLGWVELYKGQRGADTEYLVKSEITRWYAIVLKSSAEQVEQDAVAVVK